MYLGKSLPLNLFFLRHEFDRWVCGSRHLSHICFEVLKNALRAVVEKHGPASDSFPPIRMLVAEGEEVSPLQTQLIQGHYD
jgi:hypothetical protein